MGVYYETNDNYSMSAPGHRSGPTSSRCRTVWGAGLCLEAGSSNSEKYNIKSGVICSQIFPNFLFVGPAEEAAAESLAPTAQHN